MKQNQMKGPSHTEEAISPFHEDRGEGVIGQDEINIQKLEREQKVKAEYPHNPYIVAQDNHNNFNHLQPNPYNAENLPSDRPRSPRMNQQTYLNGVAMDMAHQPGGQGYNPPNNYGQPPQNYQQQPTVIQNQDQVFINGAPQTVVIVNENPKPMVKDNYWPRRQRVGCCCFSVHHQSYCCDYYCINTCCTAIQNSNLCCYCHSADCIHCCVHRACRTCCLEKQFCDCMLECCKHMPLCLLIDCLKDSQCCDCMLECCKHMPLCLLIDCLKDSQCCECLIKCCQDINICECIEKCDHGCVGQVCEALCNVVCCLFK